MTPHFDLRITAESAAGIAIAQGVAAKGLRLDVAQEELTRQLVIEGASQCKEAIEKDFQFALQLQAE